MHTDAGTVDLEVPRDRAGSFEPKIVAKRQTRLDGFNEQIVALYAKGMTVRDVQAHLAEVYGVEASCDLISRVTDGVWDELEAQRSRPSDSVYPVVFIEALMVKVGDGSEADRPAYLAVGIDLDGRKHILGVWIGDTDQEGSKYWAGVLSDLRNRGLHDVLIVVCDGLRGLPEAIEATWPQATVQTCAVHLLRASSRYAPWKHRRQVTAELKAVYTAPGPQAALAALDASRPASAPDTRPSCRCGGTGGSTSPRFWTPPRSPPGHLHHQHDRVGQPPAPQGHTQPGGTHRNERSALKHLHLAIRNINTVPGQDFLLRSRLGPDARS